jgi:predicted RNA-binding protein YlxR (DUF448 family)
LPRRNEPIERTCIVTRRAEPVGSLIRFVLAPDGTVVPDLRRRLPGRGAWVTASRDAVHAAEKKRLFSRGLRADAKVVPGLAERVADQLRDAALSALSLARKAGTLVTGFAKVESALARDHVVAVIHAADAGEDGVAKLAAAARRAGWERLPAIRSFTGRQLDLAFGRTNAIHAALLTGPASENALARVRAFVRYIGEDEGPHGADRDENNALTELTNPVPGTVGTNG